MQFHATRAETVLARLEAKHGRLKSHDIRRVARLVIDQMQTTSGMTSDTVAEAVLVAAVALREAVDHSTSQGGPVPKVTL